MATKTITITEDAYFGLVANKGQKDSFSDVIKRLTSRSSLYDLVGIIGKDYAGELKQHSKNIRKQMTEQMQTRVVKLK